MMTTETTTIQSGAAPLADAVTVAPDAPTFGEPRLVVLGGGVAGLTAAYELRRRLGDRAEITVVSESDRFTLGPALLWVPFGRSTNAISFPIKTGLVRRGIRFVLARANRVDVERRVVLAGGVQHDHPPFTGATGIWKSPGLTDERGFVPVDAGYRHLRYPQIYAAGLAAHLTVSSPLLAGLPKTGYLSMAMARIAAQNIAAAITGAVGSRHTLPWLLDLRLLDGGDTGVLLPAADLIRPLRLGLRLPGRASVEGAADALHTLEAAHGSEQPSLKQLDRAMY